MSELRAKDLIKVLKVITDIAPEAKVFWEDGRDGESELVNIFCSAQKNNLTGQIDIILSSSD